MPKSVYTEPRYWYHVSSTLTQASVKLKPWTNEEGFNRSGSEPNTARICVAPTIEQCFVAIPYRSVGEYTVYKTVVPRKAIRPTQVFDASVTQEGWLTTPTTFIKIGTIDMEKIADDLGEDFPKEKATFGCPDDTQECLRKWRNWVDLEKYLKPA